ncbi:hypothetical protein [Kitasatospora sp. LaBMicrA B282]|uniref:hypothetical protein n=1 Tax=Kitasatospora sp. LaBMicrA B282 TaxID=3420949 RepID=UPI003D0DB255
MSSDTAAHAAAPSQRLCRPHEFPYRLGGRHRPPVPNHGGGYTPVYTPVEGDESRSATLQTDQVAADVEQHLRQADGAAVAALDDLEWARAALGALSSAGRRSAAGYAERLPTDPVHR